MQLQYLKNEQKPFKTREQSSSAYTCIWCNLMFLIYQTFSVQHLCGVSAPSGLILLFVHPLSSPSAYCEEQSRWACTRLLNHSSVVACGGFPVRRTTSTRTLRANSAFLPLRSEAKPWASSCLDYELCFLWICCFSLLFCHVLVVVLRSVRASLSTG